VYRSEKKAIPIRSEVNMSIRTWLLPGKNLRLPADPVLVLAVGDDSVGVVGVDVDMILLTHCPTGCPVAGGCYTDAQAQAGFCPG